MVIIILVGNVVAQEVSVTNDGKRLNGLDQLLAQTGRIGEHLFYPPQVVVRDLHRGLSGKELK